MLLCPPNLEITQCKGNVTKCGHGCLTTDKEQICVCPEGSVLQSNGQACSGMENIAIYKVTISPNSNRAAQLYYKQSIVKLIY